MTPGNPVAPLFQLAGVGVPGARRIFSAVMPIIKSSRSLRDVTILIIRKALFNPQVRFAATFVIVKLDVTGIAPAVLCFLELV
jgi:hypothetical protein